MRAPVIHTPRGVQLAPSAEQELADQLGPDHVRGVVARGELLDVQLTAQHLDTAARTFDDLLLPVAQVGEHRDRLIR